MVAAVEKAKVPNMVWYNYRRVPAVTLAKQLIDEGRLGQIFHYRAKFLQDWTISRRPAAGRRGLVAARREGRRQRRDRRSARALHRHRAVAQRRHRQRHRDDRDVHQGAQAHAHRQGREGRHRRRLRCSSRASATVRSPRSNPPATPAATRRSTRSRSTARTPRIFWDLHDLHRLQYFDHRDEGTRARLAQSSTSPTAIIRTWSNWWVPGLQIGYEHTLRPSGRRLPQGPAKTARSAGPTFKDGLATDYVTDAVLKSAKTGRWEKVKKVK